MQHLQLPQVDAGNCVHALVVQASCRACVEACPRSAWVMDDDGLGLDTTACDGCAICVAACPQDAIDLPRPSVARSPNSLGTALVACERTDLDSDKAVLPCLNAIGLDELAGLYAAGVRRLQVCRADCAACDRGRSRPFDHALADLQRMLADRHMPPIAVKSISPADWPSQRDRELQPSRRSLFNAFRAQPSASTDAVDKHRPAALALASGPPRSASPTPHSPCIDIATCEACDACARVCPHDAIRLETDDTARTAYRIAAERCTACRMCVDVCAAGAITIERWAPAAAQTIVFDTAQCTVCGNTYRLPQGRSASARLCRICAKTRHAGNLFQVMK